MKNRVLCVIASFLLAGSAYGQKDADEVLRAMAAFEREGRFSDAEALAAAFLAKHLPPGTADVADAAERLRRLRREYRLTKDALREALRKSLDGLTDEEFARFDAEGRFDKRTIDGTVFYMNASRSNLFFRYPELKARRKDGKKDTLGDVVLPHIREAKSAASSARAREVLPAMLEATMTVTVEKDALPAGKVVRCWMPIPRSLPHQRPGGIVESDPPVPLLDRESSLMRAAYLERPAVKGAPTAFRIRHRFTSLAVVPGVPPTSPPDRLSTEDLSRYTTETPPHVVFTPKIRAASKEIVSDAAEKGAIARRIYDWIGDHISYSYCVEYSTSRNLSEATLLRRYGDCGEESLLFITLCRLNGIPARWQSGWAAWPGNVTMHDWAEIWLDGVGWAPVDPYMAVYAKGKPDAMRTEIRDFYFGGLDHWRLITNSDHGVPLVPNKPSLRSDTVDFQRGEVECDGKNVYFDRFDYEMEIREVVP
jgi:hypothetical protein